MPKFFQEKKFINYVTWKLNKIYSMRLLRPIRLLFNSLIKNCDTEIKYVIEYQ